VRLKIPKEKKMENVQTMSDLMQQIQQRIDSLKASAMQQQTEMKQSLNECIEQSEAIQNQLVQSQQQLTSQLEYGTAVIEMHKTSIKPGQKVLIVDDLIATGGTTQAMISLVERLGGEVAGVLVLIELAGLKGREAIAGYRLDSAIVYEGK